MIYLWPWRKIGSFGKTSYFYFKSQLTMTRIKLTAFPLIVFVSLLVFSSCEKTEDKKVQTDFSKNGITLTGAQVPSASPALGSLNVFFTRNTRILSYTITWSGLSGNPNGFGIYGLAPVGFAVAPTTPVQTISTTGLTSTGTYTGTLLIDGIVVKEQDLLNGLYYVLIRTAAYPSGEIRAQIKFQ